VSRPDPALPISIWCAQPASTPHLPPTSSSALTLNRRMRPGSCATQNTPPSHSVSPFFNPSLLTLAGLRRPVGQFRHLGKTAAAEVGHSYLDLHCARRREGRNALAPHQRAVGSSGEVGHHNN